MAEIEAPAAPEQGQQAEPQAVEEATGWTDNGDAPEDQVAEVPVPEPPKNQLDPEELVTRAAEQGFQKTASWIGRRDKELLDNIGNLIESRLKANQPPPQTKEDSPTEPADLLENPERWARSVVPRILEEEVNRRAAVEQTYNANLIQNAAKIMDSDPLFEDKNLGNLVIEEIHKSFPSVNKRLSPDVSARLLVSTALENVVRRSVMVKRNPLAHNTPSNKPIGTVSPSPAATRTPKSVPLSEAAKSLAKRFNYNQEDLNKVFGEG